MMRKMKESVSVYKWDCIPVLSLCCPVVNVVMLGVLGVYKRYPETHTHLDGMMLYRLLSLLLVFHLFILHVRGMACMARTGSDLYRRRVCFS